MVQIVAFEGKRNPRIFLAWGTAAIRKGDLLVNTTRQISSAFDASEFRALVSDGALTELASPIDISDEEAELQLVVLEVEAAEGFKHELRVDQNRITSVLTSSTSGSRHYYVFASHEVFRSVASTLIGQFLNCLLYLDDDWQEGHDKLLRSAIALDAHHPVVNALRASRSASPAAFLPIARSNLRSDEARSIFETAWAAFTQKDLRYVLKYQGGLVREEGGMQIGDVAKLMRSILDAHSPLASSIVRIHPFLKRPPETQLYELVAASAEFHFTVPPVSLGERLARYLELQMFEQALDGKLPSDGPASSTLVEAVQQIASPTEETIVLQRLGTAALRAVRPAVNVEPAEEWSEPLTVLGYQSGLVKDTEQIEINLFPGYRILVSSTDNGSGQTPLGLDFLQTSKDFLFRPTLYKIQRWRNESRERFFLQEVVVLQPGTSGKATAVHSSIVSGAFVCNLSINVTRRTASRLSFGSGSLSGVDAQAVGDARKWMLSFVELCREIELGDTRHARLVPHAFKMPYLYEVLWAVAELGGSAHQTDIVQAINTRFSKSALVNNTRREVIRNPALISFDEEDSQVLVISSEGRRYLAACNRVARRAR